MATRITENALEFSSLSKMSFKVKVLKEETGGFWQNIPFPFPIVLKFWRRRSFKNGVQFREDEEDGQPLWDHERKKFYFHCWTSGQEGKSKEKRSNFQEKYDDYYFDAFIEQNTNLRQALVEYVIDKYRDIDFTPKISTGLVLFEGNWSDQALPTGEDYDFRENFKTMVSITASENSGGAFLIICE